jgi:hypothetical protein
MKVPTRAMPSIELNTAAPSDIDGILALLEENQQPLSPRRRKSAMIANGLTTL